MCFDTGDVLLIQGKPCNSYQIGAEACWAMGDTKRGKPLHVAGILEAKKVTYIEFNLFQNEHALGKTEYLTCYEEYL